MDPLSSLEGSWLVPHSNGNSDVNILASVSFLDPKDYSAKKEGKFTFWIQRAILHAHFILVDLTCFM